MKAEEEIKHKARCINCGNEATKGLTPDLDIKGIQVCDECCEEVGIRLLISIETGNSKWFEKKHYKN